MHDAIVGTVTCFEDLVAAACEQLSVQLGISLGRVGMGGLVDGFADYFRDVATKGLTECLIASKIGASGILEENRDRQRIDAGADKIEIHGRLQAGSIPSPTGHFPLGAGDHGFGVIKVDARANVIGTPLNERGPVCRVAGTNNDNQVKQPTIPRR